MGLFHVALHGEGNWLASVSADYSADTQTQRLILLEWGCPEIQKLKDKAS